MTIVTIMTRCAMQLHWLVKDGIGWIVPVEFLSLIKRSEGGSGGKRMEATRDAGRGSSCKGPGEIGGERMVNQRCGTGETVLC